MTQHLTARGMDDHPEVQLWQRLYAGCSDSPLPTTWHDVPHTLRQYLANVYDLAHEPHPQHTGSGQGPWRSQATGDPRTMLVAFSGGKDSTASALVAQAEGYEPLLYHVAGLNRAYPMEATAAQGMADRLGFPMVVQQVKLAGRAAYMDNPVKNQLVLALMLAFGAAHGVRHHTLGDMRTDVLAVTQLQCNGSDAYEQLQAWEGHAAAAWPLYTYHHLLRHVCDSLGILLLSRPDLLEHVYGCVAPHRFREQYRAKNQAKYPGLLLLPNRCGSCWKCCAEAIALHRMGYEGQHVTPAFLDHCAEYLRRQLPREKPLCQRCSARP